MLIDLKWVLMMCEPQGSPLKKKLLMVAPQEIAADLQQLQLYSGCWCSSNSTEVLSKGVTPALPLRHKKDQNNDAANYTFKEMAAKDLLVAELLSEVIPEKPVANPARRTNVWYALEPLLFTLNILRLNGKVHYKS